MGFRETLKCVLILIVFLSGCTAFNANKTNNETTYYEKSFDAKKIKELRISSDYGKIEIFSWNKEQVTFEATEKKGGCSFDLNSGADGDAVYLKSKANAVTVLSGKNCIGLQVFIPKWIKKIKMEVGHGKVKLTDDLECNLVMELGEVKADINNISGYIDVKGENSDITISDGILMHGSKVVLDSGNLSLNVGLEQNSEYDFETGKGNINLELPSDSKVKVEAIGEVERNDFEPMEDDSLERINIKSMSGKISIRKHGL